MKLKEAIIKARKKYGIQHKPFKSWAMIRDDGVMGRSDEPDGRVIAESQFVSK